MTIKIDENVPMPERAKARKHSIYPFDDMEISDSFFVEGVKGREFCRFAYEAGKRFNKKFAVRSVEGGCRCWRIENV